MADWVGDLEQHHELITENALDHLAEVDAIQAKVLHQIFSRLIAVMNYNLEHHFPFVNFLFVEDHHDYRRDGPLTTWEEHELRACLHPGERYKTIGFKFGIDENMLLSYRFCLVRPFIKSSLDLRAPTEEPVPRWAGRLVLGSLTRFQDDVVAKSDDQWTVSNQQRLSALMPPLEPQFMPYGKFSFNRGAQLSHFRGQD